MDSLLDFMQDMIGGYLLVLVAFFAVGKVGMAIMRISAGDYEDKTPPEHRKNYGPSYSSREALPTDTLARYNKLYRCQDCDRYTRYYTLLMNYLKAWLANGEAGKEYVCPLCEGHDVREVHVDEEQPEFRFLKKHRHTMKLNHIQFEEILDSVNQARDGIDGMIEADAMTEYENKMIQKEIEIRNKRNGVKPENVTVNVTVNGKEPAQPSGISGMMEEVLGHAKKEYAEPKELMPFNLDDYLEKTKTETILPERKVLVEHPRGPMVDMNEVEYMSMHMGSYYAKLEGREELVKLHPSRSRFYQEEYTKKVSGKFDRVGSHYFLKE